MKKKGEGDRAANWVLTEIEKQGLSRPPEHPGPFPTSHLKPAAPVPLARPFPLLRKIRHEITRQGPWALAAQEARCSGLNLRCAEGPGLGGLGPPSVSPLVKESVSVQNLTGSTGVSKRSLAPLPTGRGRERTGLSSSLGSGRRGHVCPLSSRPHSTPNPRIQPESPRT